MKYGMCLDSREKENLTFTEFAKTLKDFDIKAETYNEYFNKGMDIKVVVNDGNSSSLDKYTKIGMERAAILGGEAV